MPSTRARRGGPPSTEPRSALADIVDHIGHLLPAQGPIHVFIHHNTLHAFEHLPFDDAVVEAGRLFGCEPYLTEDRYRGELRRGRIHTSDVRATLAEDLGARGDERVVGRLSRLELRYRVLLRGVPARTGPALQWTLDETDVLERLRPDLPTEARESFGVDGLNDLSPEEERRYVRALWDACRDAAQRAAPPEAQSRPAPMRDRDLVLGVSDMDLDAWVHPVLIRVSGAFLDQGLGDWTMPGRERGLHRCFVDLYHRRLARLCGPMGAALQRVVREDHDRGHDGPASLAWSLDQLGVDASEREPFLRGEALALRGFAGMVRQLELRPDRVPATAVPARLEDFLAVRLLLLRAALAHAGSRLGFDGSLPELRAWLQREATASAPPSTDERAWPLFHLAQLAGLSPQLVRGLGPDAVGALEAELTELDGTARRRLLHRAYERHLRHRFFDALTQHPPAPPLAAPAYQAAFCLDDREESMRRHLEEVDPEAETFGVAGFFGVAMYYRAATDARARPLCPVAIRPRHFVAEVADEERAGARGRLARRWARLGALVDKNVHLGSRRARSGAVLFATVGVLWVVPLVVGVVFPWVRRGLARMGPGRRRAGRLAIEHAPGVTPPLGDRAGFTVEEMADVVLSQLAPIGMRRRFAPLVLLFGHGSTSLNNPHASAYDCGACGGGHGGPNARAFAQMANDPRVRERLAQLGLAIPAGTWFVGGERNTSSNEISLYDEDLVPGGLRDVLARAKQALDDARRRDAHERARRFESAALWLPPDAALIHVEARSDDLAQPRPELGHATNAVCLIGRRERTRGLFLDRRAFLVSYDPSDDPSAALLEGLLAAVVPVIAGISLEYLFSHVDRSGYGAGTKLPHNISALVGVMDGAQSDLRTGLPWQMVEVHEPVRVALVVEAEVSALRRVLARSDALRRLVDHEWLYLAALDPGGDAIVELTSTSARPYTVEHPLSVCRARSLRH